MFVPVTVWPTAMLPVMGATKVRISDSTPPLLKVPVRLLWAAAVILPSWRVPPFTVVPPV